MGDKAPHPKTAQGNRGQPRRGGQLDIRQTLLEPLKPPQLSDLGIKEPPPKPSNHPSDEPRRATMLENGGTLTGPVNTKLCILFLILSVVLLSALTITVLVVGRHPSHSNTKPGGMMSIGIQAGGANDLVFDLTDEGVRRRELITYYYDLVLSDDVQQWQTFPKNAEQLPEVNASLHTISSYDVCCFSDQEMWICSNGHTFDPYAFEARLQSLSNPPGGVQCLIYINSRHLARSQCTLEIRMRS
jgi:hypothetical protein